MAIYEFEGVVPVVHPQAFVHPDAVLIGDVRIGPDCYIGPGASLRGDFSAVVLGPGCNVQDNAVLHGTPGLTRWSTPEGISATAPWSTPAPWAPTP